MCTITAFMVVLGKYDRFIDNVYYYSIYGSTRKI